MRREDVDSYVRDLLMKIEGLELEIERLKVLKDSIHNLRLIQEPTISSRSISNNIKSRILASAIAGFIFAICLAFLLEYYEQFKKPALQQV